MIDKDLLDGSYKWRINEFYRPIAEKLVNRYAELRHILVGSILFVDNTEDRGKHANKFTNAKIYKVPDRFQDIIQQLAKRTPPAYIMEFYKRNIEEMSREQIIMLVYHELRHIALDGSIRLHDLEDWPELVATFGADWAKTKSLLPDLTEDEVDWQQIQTRQLGLFTEPTLADSVAREAAQRFSEQVPPEVASITITASSVRDAAQQIDKAARRARASA